MLKKNICLIIIILFAFQPIFSEKKKTKKLIITKKDLENFTELSFDEVIFNEDELMRIADNKNNTVIYYERFDYKKNKNLKNVKIFNENKELLITIVYLYQRSGEYQIHFKNYENKRGFINISKDPGVFITYEFDINYYKEGFELKYLIDVGEEKNEKTGKLYYNNDLILFYKNIIYTTKNKEKSNIYVEKNFLENNREEAGFWTFILSMII
jgi:hypothetical protein